MAEFPHMLPGDVELWKRFLFDYGKYFEKFDYDVRVGEGIPVDPAWPENIKVAAKLLTQKRIDAIGYHREEVWIFEVKPDAGLSALGQLLGYRDLYVKQFGEPKKLYLAIVTDRINPDEEYLFKKNGIRIYVV